MDQQGKIEVALRACQKHEQTYGVKVPDRVQKFFETGEAFRYDRKCLPPGTDIPMFEAGSFRLAVTVPSWETLSELGGLDDAVVGPEGDWEHAGKYLPLFTAEQSRYILARIDDPACPVGWFEEETWEDDGDGYREGAFILASSLDEFLASLADLDEATYEVEADEDLWEA